MDGSEWIFQHIDQLSTGACMVIAILYFYRENVRIRQDIHQEILTEIKYSHEEIRDLIVQVERNREVFKESIINSEKMRASLTEDIKELKKDMKHAESSISSSCSLIKSVIMQRSVEGFTYYDRESQKLYTKENNSFVRSKEEF